MTELNFITVRKGHFADFARIYPVVCALSDAGSNYLQASAAVWAVFHSILGIPLLLFNSRNSLWHFSEGNKPPVKRLNPTNLNVLNVYREIIHA